MIDANIDLANRKRHAVLRSLNTEIAHESVSTTNACGRISYFYDRSKKITLKLFYLHCCLHKMTLSKRIATTFSI